MIRLENLEWTHSWTSLVGCLHGCLKYLEADPGLGWLFGGTGHGLIINMSRDGSCPSGPTAWRTSRFFELGRNLGYQINGVFAHRQDSGWKENQIKAWDLTRSAIEKGYPVIGWELAIPEFYVITGFDDTGYYYNGPGAERGPSPKPWDELGESGIGMLEVFSVETTQPAAELNTVREALEFVLAFNNGAVEWVLPEYLAGLKAYQAWIEAVGSGRANLMGHAYNAAVWEECRRNGLDFLQQAHEKLPGRQENEFLQAITAYQEAASQLKAVTDLYPFFENNREEPVGKNPTSQQAADHLQKACSAEEKGLAAIASILEGLD